MYEELSREDLVALEKRLDASAEAVGCKWHWSWEAHETPSGALVDVIRCVLRRDGQSVYTRMGKDHKQAGERMLESLALMAKAAS